MKNILLGSIFILLVLPQLSFGANSSSAVINPPTIVNPRVTSCDQQLGVESNAFFQSQAQERGAFMKANPNVIASHDKRFTELLAIDVAHRLGKSDAGLP